MKLPEVLWQDVDVAEAKSLRHAFGGFATGVAIVTCLDANHQPVGLTINSFSSVSLDPALVLWSLVNHSPSRQVFEQAEYFAINILGAHQQDIGLNFSKPISDKFQHGVWDVSHATAPILEGCVVQFICRRVQQIEAGDHQIFLGKIETCRHSNQSPLLFCKGQFTAWPQYQEAS
jgi:flavin reductase (DIM6/NTAB) family NADH-FMN oxidoreductase RutF